VELPDVETAVVLGGAGFVGSHLCDALLAEGYAVICVDNLLTGKRENIAHLEGHPAFQFLEHDVSQPFAIPQPFHYLFHLASPASPVDFETLAFEIMEVNGPGTRNALEVARRAGARFLLASTSEVYGEPLVHPQREDYWGNVNPIGVRSCYDESKRFAEALTMAYLRYKGVDARIVRIFNTYGPRMRLDDGRVVPNFVGQALRGEPLTVYGDGHQTRSFCYVSDLVAGIMRVMFSPQARGEVFNLGNPDERTILEFARLVVELTGSSSPIEFRPLRHKDDPSRRCPDITKARTMLGWEPVVSLREGLARTIAWFRRQLAAGTGCKDPAAR
jgi:dTDP-glucose 4,6-dehydratase